jgi:hypothetical protein
MNFREFIETICFGSIIASLVLYAIIFVLSVLEYLKLKRLVFILLLMECVGFIYDGLIITLGKVMSDDVLKGTNIVRYIMHGILVPFLIAFTGYALRFRRDKLYINWVITLICIIIGLLAAIFSKMKIEDLANVKRCGIHEDTPNWVNSIYNVLNIGSVIYMIIAGLILLILKREFFYFLSGLFMLIFSAIGPATGNADLTFIFSIYGEMLMIIFLFVFFKKYG